MDSPSPDLSSVSSGRTSVSSFDTEETRHTLCTPTKPVILSTPRFESIRPGIPQSRSSQNVHFHDSLFNTPQKSFEGQQIQHTGAAEIPVAGHHTEPRNYAPRTAGLPIYNQPPPKFGLNIARAPISGNAESEDAFIANLASLSLRHLSDSSSIAVPSPQNEIIATNSERIQPQCSAKLNLLQQGQSGNPSLQQVMGEDYFPFYEKARQCRPKNNGVVKLGNIPFATTRSEIIALMGKSSRICNDAEEPVHIIMERVSSKTMDAYVEFVDLDDAMRAVERHQSNQASGRVSRLGNRPVVVELSSQAHLMADLFPAAKGIFWNGVNPEVKESIPNEPWENFKGFITEEEMVMLVKHVEVPQRSPYSKDCPQRSYEALISVLYKFPWRRTDLITIKQRNAIFQATCNLMKLLMRSIERGDNSVQLTNQLLQRIALGGLRCPGFTPTMKDDIIWMMHIDDTKALEFEQPPFADKWRHLYGLSPKPGFPGDLIEWYISIIREQTQREYIDRPLDQRSFIRDLSQDTDSHWGYFWVELGYESGPSFDNLTLAQAAYRELDAIERILARALANKS